MKTLAFVTMMMCLIIGSCDDPEGKWDEMKWKSETAFTRGFPHEVRLNAAGDSVTFTCTNYRLMGAQAFVVVDGYATYLEDTCKYWFDISWCDNVFTVTAAANNTGAEREFEVQPYSGDAFDSFTFTQPSIDW